MSTIETRVLQRIEAVFVRCPELFRFSVRDRSGLPDHIDPTKIDGELFIFEIALMLRQGKALLKRALRWIVFDGNFGGRLLGAQR